MFPTINDPTIKSVNNPPQLYFVPDDIWIKIISSIDSLQDKSSLSLTQRCVYQVFNHHLIWNPLLEEHFPDSLSESSNLKGIHLYKNFTKIKRNIVNGQHKFETILVGALRPSHKSRKGTYRQGKSLFVLDWASRPRFDENDIESKIPSMVHTYDLDSGKLLMQNFVMIETDPDPGAVGTHDHGFSPCMCVQGDHLFISGHHVVDSNSEQVVNVLDRHNNTVIQTFQTNRKDFHITSLCVDENSVYAGGSFEQGNGVIMRWDRCNQNAQPQIFQNPESRHLGEIKVCKDRLFAQIGIGTIQVFDLKNFEKLQKFECGVPATFSLFFEVHDNLLFISRIDSYWTRDIATIHVLDLSNKEATLKEIYRSDIESNVRIQMCGSSLQMFSWSNSISVLNFNSSPKELKTALPPKDFGVILKDQHSENLGSAPRFPQKISISPEDYTPLLLKDLGILSREQYSENLGCAPHHLQKIGILSDADISILGIDFCPISHLQPLQVVVENSSDYRDLQKAAFEKKDNMKACLNVLKSKAEERLSCSILNYEKVHNPWDLILGKINAVCADLQNRSRTPKSLISTFEPEAYSHLVDQINTLIEEFNSLESKHQVSVLKAYVSQWGILRAWTNLNQKGIFCLNDLLNSDQNISRNSLFRMGE